MNTAEIKDALLRENVRGIVAATMRAHPKSCVFKSNAIELIVNDCLSIMGKYTGKENLITACTIAFRNAELLCPAHNGEPEINRMPTA